MYSERSFRFVKSSSLPISCCSLSCMSIAYALHILNDISWCYILHVFGYLINYIVHKFQFTSKLYLTSQSYSKNMSMIFKSVTTVLICSLCPLISISSGMNHMTSPFLVPSTLKTSNTISAGLVLIFSPLTSCLSISIYIYLESTSAYNYSSFSFYVLTFICTFSSLYLSFCWFEITY